MVFQGICLKTDDIPRLSAFYAALLGCEAEENDIHVDLQTQTAALAIYRRKAAVSDMGFTFPPDQGTVW